MINKKLIRQRGQIVIVVLLVSAVVLTLGLSASSKSVTDTKISTNEESLKNAFNTAESAINNYVNGGGSSYTSNGNNAIVNSSDIGGNTSSLSSEGQVLANSNQLFWLVGHKDNSDIDISDYYRGDSIDISVTNGFSGALKIDYFYIDNSGNYQVDRFGCNYNNSNVVTGFNTDTSRCSQITVSGTPLLLSITPIGSATSITVSGANFPVQGQNLTSVGESDDGVKTQIKTKNIYQVPFFILDTITARNSI